MSQLIPILIISMVLDDLNDAGDPISNRSAIRHFIFTLGPEFEAIQNNYHIGNLPPQ